MKITQPPSELRPRRRGHALGRKVKRFLKRGHSHRLEWGDRHETFPVCLVRSYGYQLWQLIYFAIASITQFFHRMIVVTFFVICTLFSSFCLGGNTNSPGWIVNLDYSSDSRFQLEYTGCRKSDDGTYRYMNTNSTGYVINICADATCDRDCYMLDMPFNKWAYYVKEYTLPANWASMLDMKIIT